MSYFPGNLIRFLLGMALGVLLLILGVRMLLNINILGLAIALAGSIVVSLNITSILSEPWGSLYGSGQRSKRPRAMYSIPEARRINGHYEEAIKEYQKIADTYPDQLRAYVAMIEISVVYLSDEERAMAFFREGAANLKRAEDKEALAKMFSAIRTRFDEPKPPRKISLKSERT
jgi:tetratricopeptide (TPR) repeat protein